MLGFIHVSRLLSYQIRVCLAAVDGQGLPLSEPDVSYSITLTDDVSYFLPPPTWLPGPMPPPP